MIRLQSFVLAALAAGFAGTAAGQVPGQPFGGPQGPMRTPAFSPYLNLARRDVNPAINYFGIVRPQLQFASSIQALQSQSNQINPYASFLGNDQELVTGKVFGFQNHLNFYQNQFVAGGLGAGIGPTNRNPGMQGMQGMQGLQQGMQGMPAQPPTLGGMQNRNR